MTTPKYLLCPTCGNTLSEQVTVNPPAHLYRCGKCGYSREGRNG